MKGEVYIVPGGAKKGRGKAAANDETPAVKKKTLYAMLENTGNGICKFTTTSGHTFAIDVKEREKQNYYGEGLLNILFKNGNYEMHIGGVPLFNFDHFHADDAIAAFMCLVE